MNSILFFLLFYLMPGIVTTVILWGLKRFRDWNAFLWVKTVLFNTLSFYFVSTFIKSITGNGWMTFSSTVSKVTNSTYKHYLIIDTAVLVILLLAVLFVLKSRFRQIVETTVSVSVALIMLIMLFEGRGILNIEYSVVYIVGAVFAVFEAFTGKLGATYLMTMKGLKGRIKTWLPICVFSSVFHYLFLPLQIYLANIDQFRIRFIQLLLIALIPVLLCTVVSSLLMTLFSKRVFKWTKLAVFAVTVMKYLQGVALNGQMKSMEGFSQTWNENRLVINNVIWIMIIGLLIVLGMFIKKVGTLYEKACPYITCLFALTIVFMTFSAGHPDQIGLTAKGSLEVNKNKNTIVFILDKYDAQFFERIAESDPSFTDDLADFTYYPNVTGAWAYTDRSVPYFLTDVDGLVGVSEYVSRDNSYANSDLLQQYSDEGYKLGVYTNSRHIVTDAAKLLENYDATPTLECNIPGCISTMLRMAQYSSMPLSLKSRYSYSDTDCLIMADFTGVWNNADDTIFYDMLKNEGLSVSDDDAVGAFKFIHLFGAHQPYIMNENCESVSYEGAAAISAEACDSQAKGSMRVVYEYLNQLKELGQYENSTILIIADHGQNFSMDHETDYIEGLKVRDTCIPLMLVKMPNQHNDSGIMEVNETAATQAEMIETVRESITGNKVEGRKRLDEVEDGDYIERRTIRILQTLGESTEFIIHGDARNPENWEARDTDFEVVIE